MNTMLQKGFIAVAILGFFAVAGSAHAQSYGYPYGSSYQYQQPSYGSLYYGTPIVINQSGSYMPNYMPMNMPSYTYGAYQQQYQPSYMSQYQPVYAPTYGQPSYPNYGSYGYGSYGSNDANSYYPYTNTYRNANSYPRYVYSSPSYDPTYAWFSNYYQQYPSTVGVYTGNTDLFGTPLCNWGGGYNGYACDSDPSQPVYDPYTGSWY